MKFFANVCNFSVLLKILDVHSNELTHLPEDIGCLTGLQVLNADHNKIKKLPLSIGQLQALEILSVAGKAYKCL